MRSELPPAPKPILMTAAQRRRANLFRWFSPKANRMMEAPSYLAFRHLLWREVDPSVLALCERPNPPIDCYVQGEYLKYTFDAWVRFGSGEERFVEVTPKANLARDAAPKQWALVLSWCDNHALRCEWVTDEQFAPHQQLLDNWEQLLPYVVVARRRADVDMRERLQTLFQCEGALTLSSIPGFCLQQDPECVIAEVWAMVYEGELSCELTTTRVTRSSVIRTVPHQAT